MEINTNSGRAEISELPNNCPFCHHLIRPVPLYGLQTNYISPIEVFMACPNSSCKRGFIAYYDFRANSYVYTGQTTKGNIVEKAVSKVISAISPKFKIIYNQSFAAEQQQLFEICGVGYRKALEFLIKDYAVSKEPNKKEEIENKLLMPCIESFVDDLRIKSVAKRAVWLGNDETHYTKKWEGKNVEDLKRLIDLTIHWIEMERLTHDFELDMPTGKK